MTLTGISLDDAGRYQLYFKYQNDKNENEQHIDKGTRFRKGAKKISELPPIDYATEKEKKAKKEKNKNIWKNAREQIEAINQDQQLTEQEKEQRAKEILANAERQTRA